MSMTQSLSGSTPVGEVLHGHVSAMSDLGFGYVLEARSGRLFAIARKFVDPRKYDKLKPGDRISFLENGHNAVAVLVD